MGNYTPEYVGLFAQALGDERIWCQDFVWSGANHHAARVVGAARLLQQIADRRSSGQLQSGERVLLFGHSHAGQVFAVITQFLSDLPFAHELWEIAEEIDRTNSGKQSLSLSSLETVKEKMQGVQLDFVTFGAPPRYRYRGLGQQFRLLQIVNHRGQLYWEGLFGGR